MKIYTKKGDKGSTYLFGGGPFPKDALRIQAYGTVDELNSVLGCAMTELSDSKIKNEIQKIQKELFVLGSELSSVNPNEKMKAGFVQNVHVQAMEKQIDVWEENLRPLQQFILPGGSKASALLHLARTVCRRAEREVVSLSHQEEVRPECIVYLNRLSDYLFVMAREVNRIENQPDVLWEGILK